MEADQRDARILAGVDDLVAACAVDRGQGDCVNVLGDQVFALLELGADVLICVVLDQLDIWNALQHRPGSRPWPRSAEPPGSR